VNTIRAYGGAELQLHSFLTLALEGGWVINFTPLGESPQYPLDIRLSGPWTSLDVSKKRKSSCPCQGLNTELSSRWLKPSYWRCYPGCNSNTTPHNNARQLYDAKSNKSIKHSVPSNLVQTGIIRLCHFSAQSHVYRTQYMLLTNANVVLCQQLHTVGSWFLSTLFRFPFDSPSYLQDSNPDRSHGTFRSPPQCAV
jgi:hypothetical protein